MSSAGSKVSSERDFAAKATATTRRFSEQQLRVFEGYMAEIFAASGLDLKLPATVDTPRRFLEALLEATEGYEGDPKLIKVFDTECRGGSDCRLSQIIEGPIHFASLCEHHALPFHGRVYIGYIPHEHILGLSKLVRLVRLYTRRFAVQERIGREVADTMVEILQPHAVAVYVVARHLCMVMRGVRAVAPLTRTTVWRGEYERNRALRAEFLAACGAGRGMG
jgi:GTP cyclohydrolase IA